MTASPGSSKRGAAAAAWGAVVGAAALALALQAARGLRFETSLLALLPGGDHGPVVGGVLSRAAESSSRRVALLVGHADPARAARAADALAARLTGGRGIRRVLARDEGDMAGRVRDFYLPWRYRLLSPAQRERLSKEPDGALLARALEGLYAPLGPPKLAPLESDPLGLFSEYMMEAASRSALRLVGGRLVVQDGDMTRAAVLVELAEGGASVAEQDALLELFDGATRAALDAGAGEVLRAGFVFHSALAARQARREMSVIGLGSMLGIVVLMLMAFRSLKPLVLTLLPIAVGCVTALGLTPLLFERLHLMTLVFGTGIIGVAMDYGILFVSGCAAEGPWDAQKRRREILPSVALAVATSLLAYAALAATALPILRQMGVFTIIGLSSAWLTAQLWLPPLAARMPRASEGPVPRLLLRCRSGWPRVGRSRALVPALAAGAALSAAGIGRLRSNDDVRELYASSPETVRQQDKVQELLRLPAPGRFFVVRAPDEQSLLEREEALAADLEGLAREGVLSGFQSVSQFVPSLKRQEADAALQRSRLYREGGLAPRLFAALDSPEAGSLARAQASAKAAPLVPAAWLASPISLPLRALWLGATPEGWASLVTLSGVGGEAALQRLAALGARRDGVEFVDHLASLSGQMRRFRVTLTWLVGLGYGVVSALLVWRYRREAWRALAPALLACLGAAGLLGWLGLNANLFCVFGLLLTLDMGVDYGIFMVDKGSGDFRVSLLSTSLAAWTTLLSFGLLALSRTPVLRAFGLSVLLGIGGSWLLAPCFSTGEKS